MHNIQNFINGKFENPISNTVKKSDQYTVIRKKFKFWQSLKKLKSEIEDTITNYQKCSICVAYKITNALYLSLQSERTE